MGSRHLLRRRHAAAAAPRLRGAEPRLQGALRRGGLRLPKGHLGAGRRHAARAPELRQRGARGPHLRHRRLRWHAHHRQRGGLRQPPEAARSRSKASFQGRGLDFRAAKRRWRPCSARKRGISMHFHAKTI